MEHNILVFKKCLLDCNENAWGGGRKGENLYICNLVSGLKLLARKSMVTLWLKVPLETGVVKI